MVSSYSFPSYIPSSISQKKPPNEHPLVVSTYDLAVAIPTFQKIGLTWFFCLGQLSSSVWASASESMKKRDLVFMISLVHGSGTFLLNGIHTHLVFSLFPASC